MAKRKGEYCVHFGSASHRPMTTQCGLSKVAAMRLVREARRAGEPARAQPLGRSRRKRSR